MLRFWSIIVAVIFHYVTASIGSNIVVR